MSSPAEPATLDVAEHLRTIWRQRVPVLLASLAVALVVYLWSSARPERYEADARLAVELAQGEGRAAADDAQFASEAFAELASTDAVLDAAVADGGLDLDADELAEVVTVDGTSSAGFLVVTASGSSAEAAARTSSAVAEALVATVAEQNRAAIDESVAPLRREIVGVERELAALDVDAPERSVLAARYAALVQAVTDRRLAQPDQVRLISAPDEPASPVAPKPARDALLAFVVALVVNGELAVARNVLAGRFSRTDLRRDVEAVTGLPVLAMVPAGDGVASDEAFRELRTSLEFLAAGTAGRWIAITSAEESAGKTHVAVQLSAALAVGSATVTLIDADLRRPAVHDRAGLPAVPGLGEVLTGQASLTRVAHDLRTQDGVVSIVTAGRAVDDPAHLLRRHLVDRALACVSSDVSTVVVDTPPVSLFADALVVAAACEATLLVVDASSTRRRAVERTLSRLRAVGANPVGVVVNQAPDESGVARYYERDRGGVSSPGTESSRGRGTGWRSVAWVADRARERARTG